MKKPLSWLAVIALGGFVMAQNLPQPTRTLTPAEIKAALASVCEAKIDLPELTCLAKNSFYSKSPRAAGSQFVLNSEGIVGSFSKSGAKQIVADGGFLDANNIREPLVNDVSVLLENGTVVRYAQDRGLYGCSVFARGDGRDGLVCNQEVGTKGNVITTSVYWKEGGSETKNVSLLTLVDNTSAGNGCGNPAKIFSLDGMLQKDMNKDGKADLLVNLTFKTAANPACGIKWDKVKGQKYSLVFLWDGTAFKANAASAKIIASKGW